MRMYSFGMVLCRLFEDIASTAAAGVSVVSLVEEAFRGEPVLLLHRT